MSPVSNGSRRATSARQPDVRQPSMHPTGRNLPLLLLQARERVISHFKPVLNKYRVTEQQYRILRALDMNGPLEPRSIGEICHISSPSLAGVLARMEEVCLVARQRMPRDQRRLLVSLTPDSHALLQQMWPHIAAVYRKLDAQLGEDLNAEVYRALEGLLERLDAPG